MWFCFVFSVIIFIFYDILNGKIDVSWIDLMFGVMAIQLLRSWPAFFCRHCFKKIPLKEECILSKPFFINTKRPLISMRGLLLCKLLLKKETKKTQHQ